jgi:AI-2 transport protein TqsA
MDRTAKTGIMIIATGIVIAGLYYFRAAIVQFALAMLVYVGVEALTSWLDRRVRFLPRWLALALALVFVLAMIGWIGWFMAENIGEFTARSDQYGARIDAVITQAYGTLGLGGAPPNVQGLLRDVDGARVLGAIASGLQDVTANAVFILVYLGFILAAARGGFGGQGSGR